MIAAPRFVPAVLVAVMLSACSGGGAGVTPQGQRAGNAEKTTAASFTIHWTNASAPASVRRTKTISPSAQSISVVINGIPAAVVNNNGQSTQTVALSAPVGTDTFDFTVYDEPAGQGHLLGSAVVVQLIVDGAANQVSATIQALCAQTNVSYTPGSDPSAWATLSNAGRAQTVTSIVVAGQTKATLIIEPQDADGNVIITNNGGTVNYTITGSATVTPVDGAHIQLTPLTGPRTTTPDTLTVAASGCPSTNVGVQHSPAIYTENTSSTVYVTDWYGDWSLLPAMTSGDTLIGWDVALQKLVAYNSGTGYVYSYTPGIGSRTQLFYSGFAGAVVATWSNSINGVFLVYSTDGLYFPFIVTSGGGAVECNQTVSAGSIVAAGTLPNDNSAFYGGLTNVSSFTLGSGTCTYGRSISLQVAAVALAPVSQTSGPGPLYIFNSTSPNFVSATNESLTVTPTSSGFGFTGTPSIGAADTDAGYLYAIVNYDFEASSSSGTPLSLPAVQFGTPAAMIVVSTNE